MLDKIFVLFQNRIIRQHSLNLSCFMYINIVSSIIQLINPAETFGDIVIDYP
jgi:hypothetical protein